MPWDFIGNQNIVDYLRKNLSSGQLAHGYLFYGPEHIGKSKLADIFIASLLCEAGSSGAPCQNCRHCRQLAKGIHPDVFWVKREVDRKDIWIEQIRELRNRLGMSTFLNSYKIAVIEGAERMNPESASALLKTLEEPTPKTILILLTSKINFLPATIVSRCQVLRFKPAGAAEIRQHLMKLGAERQLAEIITNLADGRPGQAINLLADDELLSAYQEQVKNFLSIISQDISGRFKKIAVWSKEKESFSENANNLVFMLDIWQSVLRDLFLIKSLSVDLIKNIFIRQDLEKMAGRYSIGQLKNLIDQTKEAQKFLRQNANLQLVMENLVLNF